jgi:phosphoserine phosphatase
MSTLIIHSPVLTDSQRQTLQQIGALSAHTQHFRIASVSLNKHEVRALSEQLHLDLNLLPSHLNSSNFKLVISDMDSTLIAIECIDEIADMMHIKPQVSAITEAAMRGELNFEQSLTQRVALLNGLHEDALQRVYDERLTLNPGAEIWLAGLKQAQIKFALVSGGFTFFTDRLQQRLGLDFSRANRLSIAQQKLTGTIEGDIIGAQAKADFLRELCEKLDISAEQTLAVGDGANDLLMMQQAGLSIAYHAKPKVQEQADCALNYRGLDAILDFIRL